MRYKKYSGMKSDFEKAIKGFKAIPNIPGAYINASATEFITLSLKIVLTGEDAKSALNSIYGQSITGADEPADVTIWYEWTTHYINLHSGKNKGMKMIRIRGKQYGLSYIMASTFIENPYCLKRVIHKDGNHNNYHANNLAWR